jgi:hypothetical protein
MPKIIEAKYCYRGQALINCMESDEKPTYVNARRILERFILRNRGVVKPHQRYQNVLPENR